MILSVVGASALMLAAASPAMATYESPDYTDVTHSLLLGTITAVTTALVSAPDAVDASNIKIVYVEDILTSSQISVVDKSLNSLLYQAQITILKNSLNDIDVLSGGDVLTFEDFLNNNNVVLKDVISIEAFDGGRYVVFCKH
jgi:hypothetical protein